jgi:hypothetical protein
MNMRGIHLKNTSGKSNVITKGVTKMLGSALSIENTVLAIMYTFHGRGNVNVIT